MAEDISQLIVRVGLRDRAAFRALYTAASPKLMGICLRILKDRADAEEAVQEVFVRIWMHADRFVADQTSPMAWLATIARNHAIDRIRARKPQAAGIEEAAELADHLTPDPETAAIAAGEKSRIDACLEELKGVRGPAVRAAYVEGYSYQELAERYNVPINTVRTWLRRSLMKLRECLER